VGNVIFSVEDSNAYTSKIRIDAINDAFAKATSICDATSMSIVKPLTIVDNPDTYDVESHESGKLYFSESRSNVESSVQHGELKFTHHVQIVYEIR